MSEVERSGQERDCVVVVVVVVGCRRDGDDENEFSRRQRSHSTVIELSTSRSSEHAVSAATSELRLKAFVSLFLCAGPEGSAPLERCRMTVTAEKACCRMPVAADKVNPYHDGGVKVCEAASEPPRRCELCFNPKVYPFGHFRKYGSNQGLQRLCDYN